jgi:hypothetical protein
MKEGWKGVLYIWMKLFRMRKESGMRGRMNNVLKGKYES